MKNFLTITGMIGVLFISLLFKNDIVFFEQPLLVQMLIGLEVIAGILYLLMIIILTIVFTLSSLYCAVVNNERLPLWHFALIIIFCVGYTATFRFFEAKEYPIPQDI